MSIPEDENEACRVLHRLLYMALVEIRAEGLESNLPSVFGLADLLHTLPLGLAQCAIGEAQYEVLFQDLNDKAEECGCERWIENALELMATEPPPS